MKIKKYPSNLIFFFIELGATRFKYDNYLVNI